MTTIPATETVWSHLSDDLRRFIRRRVVDEHIADDLLQETFLRIHRNLGTLAETDRLAAWVYRIARNVIHDHYRANKKAPESLAEVGVADDADAAAQFRARAGVWLDELIQHLPSKYEDAVRLSEIDGLTQQEVAKRLSLSLSGAKSRIQRGRLLLRQVFEQCCNFQFDTKGNLLDCDPLPDRAVCLNCNELEIPLIE